MCHNDVQGVSSLRGLFVVDRGTRNASRESRSLLRQHPSDGTAISRSTDGGPDVQPPFAHALLHVIRQFAQATMLARQVGSTRLPLDYLGLDVTRA